MDSKEKEEKLFNYLKSVLPTELLEDLNGGVKPIEYDLVTVKKLIETGLPVEVINVLIQYVILKTDMKFPRQYALKIASHWSRKGIQTAEQALNLARGERAKRAKYKNEENENKIESARLDAIEAAVKNPDMNDEQLGKFVRNIFLNEY